MHLTKFIIFFFIYNLSQSSFAQTEFDSAKDFLSKGEYSAAIIQFKNQLKKYPKDAAARYLLGTVYIHEKEYLSAKKELKRAHNLEPKNNEYRLSYAESLLLIGQSAQAITLLEEAMKEESLNIKRIEFISSAYIANRENDKAQALLQQLLGKKNISAEQKAQINLLLAKIAISENKLEEASQLIQSTLVINPDDLQALTIKATLLLLSKKYQQAIEVYSQLIASNPDMHVLYLHRARLYIITQERINAEADLDHVLEISNTNIFANYLMAQLKLQEKNYKSAENYSNKVLNINPNYNKAVLVSGVSNYYLGRLNQAEKMLTIYIANNPNDYYAHYLMINIYLKKKNYQAAILILEGMDDKILNNSPSLLKLLSSAYFAIGEDQKAVTVLELAETSNTRDKTLLQAKIIKNFNNDDMEIAIKELDNYSNTYENTEKVDYLLIHYYIRSNQLDKAEAKLKLVLEKNTNDPALYTLKAAIEIKRSNTVQAELDFNTAIKLDKQHIPAYIGLAKIALDQNDLQLAMQYYEQAILIDKKYYIAYIALSELAMNDNDLQLAENYLLEVYKNNTDNLKTQLIVATFMAQFYEKIDTINKLEWIADDLVSRYPLDFSVLSFLARVQVKLKQYAQAEKTLNKIIYNDETDIKNRLLLANLFIIKNKSPELIIELADQILELEPDNQVALKLKNSQLIKTSSFDSAISIAQQTIENFPKKSIGYELMGDVNSAQSEIDLALDNYEKAYQIQPSTQLSNKLAWIYQNKPDYKLAAHYYLEVLKQQPNNAVALNNISWAYFQLNDPQALSYAEKAYNRQPKSAGIVDNYAYILLSNNQVEEALNLFLLAAKLSPNNKNIQYHLAKAYYIKGYTGEAKRVLKQIRVYEYSGEGIFSEQQKAIELLNKL